MSRCIGIQILRGENTNHKTISGLFNIIFRLSEAYNIIYENERKYAKYGFHFNISESFIPRVNHPLNSSIRKGNIPESEDIIDECRNPQALSRSEHIPSINSKAGQNLQNSVPYARALLTDIKELPTERCISLDANKSIPYTNKEYLEFAGMPPIKDFPEEVAELAECEEEDVAEEGGQSGEIRDFNHFGGRRDRIRRHVGEENPAKTGGRRWQRSAAGR
nr:hypothetical protein Iba_chr04fCG13270 [Ipomoea batatas]